MILIEITAKFYSAQIIQIQKIDVLKLLRPSDAYLRQ